MNFREYVKSKFNSLADWVIKHAPPRPKIVDNVYNFVRRGIQWLQGKKSIEPAAIPEEIFQIRESASAIRGFTKQYTIEGRGGIDPESFLNAVQPLVIHLLSKNRQTKVNLVLSCIMERVDIKTGEVETADVPFCSKTEVILEATDVTELYRNAVDKITESMASFQMRGSNWRNRRVVKLDINTAVYQPLRGNTYIPLPKALRNKEAIINPQNKDEECFKWCITIALNYQEGQNHPERITKELREQAEQYNWEGISFPVSLKDIDKFEKNNKGIFVNVFGYEKGIGIFPLRHTKKIDVIDLLLFSDDKKLAQSDNPYTLLKVPVLKALCRERDLRGYSRMKKNELITLLIESDEKPAQPDNVDEPAQHYCWIKNFNRLMYRNAHSMHYCKRCLNGFTSHEALCNHQTYCYEQDTVRVDLPKPGTRLSFKNNKRSMRVPFVIYADFESSIKPIDSCESNPNESFTRKIQKHIPISFCINVKCFDDSIYKPRLVTFTAKSEDDDIGQTFVDKLEEITKLIYQQFLKFPKKMVYTKGDEKKHSAATTCHICEQKFNQGEYKVRDHCHITGKYRGAAHEVCNLNYKVPNFIPVYLHNLSGYDCHLFIKKLKTSCGDEINCIPKTEENYISFSKQVIVDSYVDEEGKEKPVKRELRFIDTFKFMAASLDSLSKNLSPSQCVNLNARYTGKRFDLLRRKGVFPYEHIDSVDRLNEDRLPPKSAFYSRLNESDISDEDYEHAQTVWKEFKCETLRNYLELYNKSDVQLLTDVFESFRDVCAKHYKLDPAWYYTAPGLAWDAMLKLTKVQLQLLSDSDMLLMVKRGIRGGISTISKRYVKANNKYMGEAYDPNEPSKFISYLDANNLYGWAMSRKLPTGGFKWMRDEELENWRNMPCILEVDLEYPTELHNLHNDYPLAPENIKPPGSNVKKLIPNLGNKEKYVVHHEALKQYISLGLKVTNVHRGIKFKESAWLKMYIDLNTELRTKAKNDFEKDFFKLMNNSVYGKTLENIDNRVDVRLVADEEKATKLVAKPSYDRATIFDENLIGIHMKRTKVFYNKPIYLGMTILDLSKTLMYDFHYNYIKQKYGDKAKLLFTDTDSLMYEIETEDFYADIKDDAESRFDTSEYPTGLPIKAGVNKKVIGMFKDEACGKQIEEFVGLRAKLYSYKISGEEDHKKCKGVKKAVVRKTITHDDYKKCLFTREEQLRKMNVIRSHLHDIYTEEINKVVLSADDDKRIIMKDRISTLAHGHYGLTSMIDYEKEISND